MFQAPLNRHPEIELDAQERRFKGAAVLHGLSELPIREQCALRRPVRGDPRPMARAVSPRDSGATGASRHRGKCSELVNQNDPHLIAVLRQLHDVAVGVENFFDPPPRYSHGT